jgi:hypothetical protein
MVPEPQRNTESAMVGGWVNWLQTTKLAAESPEPIALTTSIFPVVAPAGTVACKKVDEPAVNVATTPLKRTWLTPFRPVPLMETTVPAFPTKGEKLVMEGVPGATQVTLPKKPGSPAPEVKEENTNVNAPVV